MCDSMENRKMLVVANDLELTEMGTKFYRRIARPFFDGDDDEDGCPIIDRV